MKKTLAAVAVLGAFAGSALAADVQLYGIVDTGFQYLHTDADASRAGYDATEPSRWNPVCSPVPALALRAQKILAMV